MALFASYDEALNNLLNAAPKWRATERIALSSALGRVSAGDISAPRDYPEREMSAMDGYACKSSDLKTGAKLKITSYIAAGEVCDIVINAGECVKTFTGAMLASGADCVIPIENVSGDGDGVIVNAPVNKGFAVRPKGESYSAGDILIKKGIRLDYCELALLAELGYSYINVLTRPKVAVLATGSEIVDIGEAISSKAQIHSSNHIAIAAMLDKIGCEPTLLPIIKDDEKELANAVATALKSHDFLITTGGVSVGDFDFMREFVRDLDLIVNGAAIKPGRHIKIAKMGEKFIFALPGFPYSAIVTFNLFFRPFLNRLLNCVATKTNLAVLANDYTKKSPFEEFAAAEIYNENGVLKITTSSKKSGSSAIVTNLSGSSVLLRAAKSLKIGDIVQFIKMP